MRRTNAVKLVGAVALTLAMAVNFGQAGPDNVGNPGVAPPQASAYGKTYSQWAATWWQWVVTIPASENPLFDETGANVTTGQSGPVWFLCGVWNESGSATRTATIPAGKALFFPILNYVWVSTPDEPPWNEPYTDPESGITYETFMAYQQAQIKAAMDAAEDLACEVDGVALRNLTAYREASAFAGVTLPEDNIFGIDAGTYGPGADGGYYLLLTPLRPGEHILHFHGTIGDFTLDVTYNLTVLK
jgi:hypothetical protein